MINHIDPRRPHVCWLYVTRRNSADKAHKHQISIGATCEIEEDQDARVRNVCGGVGGLDSMDQS